MSTEKPSLKQRHEHYRIAAYFLGGTLFNVHCKSCISYPATAAHQRGPDDGWDTLNKFSKLNQKFNEITFLEWRKNGVNFLLKIFTFFLVYIFV